MHLWSVNKKVIYLPVKINNMQTGIETATTKKSPAVIICLTPFSLPSARYLVISLDTVTGVPEQQIV